MKDSKDEFVHIALVFLFDKGYITPEEYLSRKSDRLNNITTHLTKYNGALVVFDFDNSEWSIAVDVNIARIVTRVDLYNKGTFQLLYKLN